MERSFFFGDQFVTDADLNNVETTVARQIQSRWGAILNVAGGFGKATAGYGTYAVAGGGVFGNPVNYLNTAINLAVTATATQITVVGGQAYDYLQNFIVITTPLVLTLGNPPGANGYWPGAALTTNYVKLKYLETSGSVKTNDAGNPFYTRYSPSYFVTVDGTPPVTAEVLLAIFTGDGVGQVTALADRRTYVRPNIMADAVWLDPTVKPVAAWTSVEDHVRAVGSGTPSPTNPHGLTGADIGIVDVEASMRLHRTDSHVNGIIVSDTSLTGALQSYSASVVVGAVDLMVFTAPTAASMSVHGTLVMSTIPNLSAATAPTLGDYWVAYNILTGTAQFLPTGSVTFDPRNPRNGVENYLRLAFANVDPVGGNIIKTVDLREFGVMSLYDIQPDVLELSSANPVVGQDGSFVVSSTTPNNLMTNLARMRYQIGVALSGSGNAWAPGAINPLTAGPSSNADAYHSHTGASVTTLESHVIVDAPEITSSLVAAYPHTVYDELSRLRAAIHMAAYGGFTPGLNWASASIDVIGQAGSAFTKSLSNQFSTVRGYPLTGVGNKQLDTRYLEPRGISFWLTASVRLTVVSGDTASLTLMTGAGLDSGLTTGVEYSASVGVSGTSPLSPGVFYFTIQGHVPPGYYYGIKSNSSLGGGGALELISWAELY